MTHPDDWALGLARLAQALGRDLQRGARRAGGGRALWRADREALGRALGLAGAELDAAVAARRRFDATAERRRLEAGGIGHVGASDPRYPRRLDELHDPPFGLFARGQVDRALAAIAAGPVVAIVGSRRATAQGRALARGLAGRLGERGAVIVSGMAHGIDAAAHEGALEGGGLTVAVLGCGIDVPYPRRNRRLAGRIAETGALLSEYWPGTAPAPWRFPARNRIVAGLAQAVAVVEAGRRSGALITADFALELGRPVLAVPGWPGALASEGCNGLLRAGAALLEGPEDVVAELADAGMERRLARRLGGARRPRRPDPLAAPARAHGRRPAGRGAGGGGCGGLRRARPARGRGPGGARGGPALLGGAPPHGWFEGLVGARGRRWSPERSTAERGAVLETPDAGTGAVEREAPARLRGDAPDRAAILGAAGDALRSVHDRLAPVDVARLSGGKRLPAVRPAAGHHAQVRDVDDPAAVIGHAVGPPGAEGAEEAVVGEAERTLVGLRGAGQGVVEPDSAQGVPERLLQRRPPSPQPAAVRALRAATAAANAGRAARILRLEG